MALVKITYRGRVYQPDDDPAAPAAPPTAPGNFGLRRALVASESKTSTQKAKYLNNVDLDPDRIVLYTREAKQLLDLILADRR